MGVRALQTAVTPLDAIVIRIAGERGVVVWHRGPHPSVSLGFLLRGSIAPHHSTLPKGPSIKGPAPPASLLGQLSLPRISVLRELADVLKQAQVLIYR